MELSLDTPAHVSRALVRTPFAEQNGEVSPDGRWLAYQSNESGRFEIYVRPLPDVDAGRWQISTDGGVQPLWSRSGRDLFYLGSNALMGVRVERGATWRAADPVKVIDDAYYHGAGSAVGRTYDIAPDGHRFLMIKPSGSPESAEAAFIVVQNWIGELDKLVPRK